ncbi:[FeFe] hydrogenase, group A [Brotaphodocola sp.]|uniref:[FeFe] hydrogenase, group A n=1 Tax=Brotaphodocola sp. TaxID=3073577 RepID=UPI003D7EBDD1
MVNLTIDKHPISVQEGTTLMEAAATLGINIPHLCYWKDLNDIGACRVCVVEVEGKERLLTACNTKVAEGMVVYTNSPKVRLDRRLTVQMILSQHDCKCATCVRSGNCPLQKIANDLNIQECCFGERLEKQPWDKTFPLIRDSEKCIKCMRCIQVCDKIQSLDIWDLEGTGARSTINVTCNRTIREADCALCGQCITHCPTGALRERDDTEKLWRALADPNRVVVVQVAPAVRAAWGEGLGLSRQEATIGKIFDALRKMGADYVFDTTFSADLTIMEEANELLERMQKGELGGRPMFTSCCPGWIRFVKSEFPQFVPQLSTAKSPMQMFGAVMKSYFADQLGKKPEDIFSVAVMPCLAKKGEAEMELYYEEYAGHDTDCVITTRELVRMIRGANILPALLKDVEPDRLFHDGSGAGVIFGATGGVMEAALRTAYFSIMGKNCEPDAFENVRASSESTGLTEAEFNLNGRQLRIAAVSGLANTRALLTAIERGEKHYDFVEVMACPGGCVGGGGQPQHDGYEMAYERGQNLYFLDRNASIRYSHMNPDVWDLYNNFFEKPLSHKAHMLLHTDHYRWQMPLSPRRDRNGHVINPNIRLQG